jgi:hypothetical protein
MISHDDLSEGKKKPNRSLIKYKRNHLFFWFSGRFK